MDPGRLGDIELEPPFLTYTDRVSLWVDDVRCEVVHPGTPAHTTNDSYVWFPERKVLFSGDLLFNGGTPFVMQGSVHGALTAIEALTRLGAETIVPGHGPVCGPEVIATVTAYLRFSSRTSPNKVVQQGSHPCRQPGRPTSVDSPTCSTPSGS